MASLQATQTAAGAAEAALHELEARCGALENEVAEESEAARQTERNDWGEKLKAALGEVKELRGVRRGRPKGHKGREELEEA
eukprot:3926421-Pleurochrysis_carterae.AAC.5